MIWFAQDSSDRVLYEIRRNDERGGFELHLIYSNGRRTIEHFQNSTDLVRGARQVQNELRGSGWRTHHS
jgi:hypothetical protein